MFKEAIAISLLFLMILSGVVYPLRANAILGIADISIDIPTVIKWVTNTVLKSILETFKQRMLEMVTNQVITWIQGGGDPRFITDFGSVAKEAFQAAAGDTIIDLGYGDLCYKPLKFQLRFQLTQPVFRHQISCTLDDVVENVAAFKENFTSGGWIAYQETLMPQNNPMGLTLLTQQEFLKRKSEEESISEYEATVGGGFLGDKRCLKWQNAETGDIKSGSEFYKETPAGVTYTGKSRMPGNGEWRCAESQTVTPGQVAGDSVAKALGADIDSLIAADDISKYIGAIINAAINRITKETVNGLAYLTTGKAGEGDCEDLEDAGAKAACYAAQEVKGAESQGQDSFSNRFSKYKDTKEFSNTINTSSGEVPEDMNEFMADKLDQLLQLKTTLLEDLQSFSGDDQSTMEKLASASSTLYEASSTNSQTIKNLEGQEDPPVRGLIQCWEDKTSEAEDAGESTSTVAALEESGEEASSTLVEAEDDRNLIDEYLATIGNYEVRREAFVSRINSAYNYDINHVTSTISQGEEFRLYGVNSDLYNFLDTISAIPETSSQIKIRVDDRFAKVNDELNQCTNQEF